MSSRLLSIAVMVSLVALLIPALPAAHTASVTLTPDVTMGNTSVSFALNVSNNGPAAIRFVNLTSPTGFNLTNGSFILPAGWIATCAPDAFCSTGSFTTVNFSAQTPSDQIASGTAKAFIFQSLVSAADGSTGWTIITADNAGDSTTRDVTVTVDSTSPFVALLEPTPASGTVLLADSVPINFTATDATMDRLILTVDGTNETITGNTTKTGLADGVHTFQLFAIDRAGNSNSTEQRTVTVDTTAPQLSGKTDVPASPASHTDNQKYQFNITATDAVGVHIVLFEFNGTANISSGTSQMVQNGSLYTVELVNLTPTTTIVRWYANDTQGKTTMAEQTYVIRDTTTPTLLSSITDLNSVTLTFSEALNPTSVRADDFSVAGNTVTNASMTTSGNVTLLLAATLATDATPNVTYTKGILADLGGNLADSASTISQDGIPPRVVAAKTGHINGSSSDKNKVHVQFSEDINGATVGMSDFSIAGKTITAVDEIIPGLVTLTLSSNFSSSPSNETPAVMLTGNGIRDLAGNTNASAAFTAADGISPEILSAHLPNTTVVRVIFSEEMDTTTFATSDFTIVNISRAVTSISFGPVFVTQAVNLTMNEPVPTDTMPTVFLVDAVADRSGNTLTTGQIVGDDRMMPVFQSARTINTTAIEVTFSELMDRSTIATGDFFITNPNNSVKAIHVHSTTVNASTFTLMVETPFGVDDTPTIATNSTVSDSRGNPQLESISITATDGILPAAENITLTFFQGLNFFSVPKRLQNASSQSALSGLNFTTLLRFDPANGWVIPTTVEPLEGYWINVSSTQTISLTFAGASVSPPPQKSIFAGWSTVGSPNTGSLDAGVAYVSIDRAYTNIAGFNNAAKTFSSAINDPNQLENLSFLAEQGRGYWIFAIQNATLAALSP